MPHECPWCEAKFSEARDWVTHVGECPAVIKREKAYTAVDEAWEKNR